MTMKDKLVKNHHKGIYYRMRAFLMSTVVFASLAMLIGFPTYFSIKAQSQKTNAEQEKVEEVEEENNNEENELLHY